MFKSTALAVIGLIAFSGIEPAQAQIPVTDFGAIVQLVQQVNYWQQQVRGMASQLNQLQSTYNSMTGTRGAQSLLSNINRNYLPSDWSSLSSALASPMQSQIRANTVLTPAQVATLSPGEQQLLSDARTNAALLQVATQQAYATTSGRFASVQQLVSAIAGATDQKGILDLQARIQAEQGMLQNDTTKVSLLYQAAQAQEWALRQRRSEQAVADIGSLRTLPALRLP